MPERAPPRTDTRRPAILVLYINDSTDDQVLFQAAAMKAGVPIDFHVAETAERGISYLKSLLNFRRKHEPRRVDLVLLDLGLPDDSGLTVLKYIRETPDLSTMPVVILTGHMNPDLHNQAYQLGANALHEKPTSFQDSVTLVGTLYSHWSTAKRPTQ